MAKLKRKLFTSQHDYDVALITLAIVYTFIMSFWFDPKWADSPEAIELVKTIGTFVPFINNLQIMPNYSSYIGFFYAIIWLLAPVMFVFGWMSIVFAGTQFIADRNNMPRLKFWGSTFIGLFILCFMFDMKVYPDYSDWRQNQLTGGFWSKAISSFIFFGIPYGFGMLFRLVFNRITFYKNIGA